MPGIAERYAGLVENGALERDPAQARAADRLQKLQDELANYKRASKSSSLGWLMARGPKSAAPRGLYIWGDVGRGKTMLMDLFFETAKVEKKRRAHFHEFMADVHDRVHLVRQAMKEDKTKDGDPIAPVASELADEALLLCFDEFHVNDIADAMVLSRLFERLFERGVVVVATSNVPPDDLYKEGLNRALFLPFVKLLRERCDAINLAARTDYRLEKLSGTQMWHVPADREAQQQIDEVWRKLAGRERGAPVELSYRGRSIRIPFAGSGAARFDFADLCHQPLGAADFVQIAHNFHTVVIEDIPVMSPAQRNEAKRFILLIDALYDNAVKLVASAAAERDEIYQGEGTIEATEFKRTSSRLIEMGSTEYLALPHGHAGPVKN
ncbi:MAG: AFG1 family ATPase [Xanthobacteraceae bacterium]|nr:AFG1 family ATPase [Xanthobacteraceae bacterium]